MSEKMKDTLVKVAEYTTAEKEKILKQLLYNTTIAFFSVIAAFISLAFNIAEITITFVAIGISTTGSSILNILQIKGSINKNKLNKIRKIGIPVCIVCIIVALLTVVLLVHLCLT